MKFGAGSGVRSMMNGVAQRFGQKLQARAQPTPMYGAQNARAYADGGKVVRDHTQARYRKGKTK